jgi:hypothetical protein
VAGQCRAHQLGIQRANQASSSTSWASDLLPDHLLPFNIATIAYPLQKNRHTRTTHDFQPCRKGTSEKVKPVR